MEDFLVVGGNIFSVFSARSAGGSPDVKAREIRALSHTTHHQLPRSEAKIVGDLRASQTKQRDNAGPFGICSMLSHNACSGGKRGFTCTIRSGVWRRRHYRCSAAEFPELFLLLRFLSLIAPGAGCGPPKC